MRSKRAFTLIELLVVIAIIALLLSILMPALTKVKTAAKNVVCRTRQKGIYTALAVYATENNNYNPSVRLNDSFKACSIKSNTGSGFDMTDDLENYLGGSLDVLNDPFCKSSVGYSEASENPGVSNIETNYGLYGGLDFGQGANKRFDDPLKFLNSTTGRKTSHYIVVADWVSYAVSGGVTEFSHQGSNSDLSWADAQLNGEYPAYVYSRFQSTSTNIGTQKLNYAYIDGSVRSFKITEEDVNDYRKGTGVSGIGDGNLQEVPAYNNGKNWGNYRTFLPAGR